jgi:hypothetical protein
VTVTGVYRALAIFFALLAVIVGYVLLRMGWSRPADFDVTGFLWFTSNAGGLAMVFFLLVCVGLAISYWVRSWRG